MSRVARRQAARIRLGLLIKKPVVDKTRHFLFYFFVI
jgi:hypothetical protein